MHAAKEPAAELDDFGWDPRKVGEKRRSASDRSDASRRSGRGGDATSYQIRRRDLSDVLVAKAPLLDVPEAAPTPGVGEERIDTTDRCTYRDADEFFSHRRDNGVTGRMSALIASN